MADGNFVSVMKSRFEEKLGEVNKSNSSDLLTEERYSELVSEVEQATKKSKKSSLDYRRIKRFGVRTIGESKKLIAATTDLGGELKYYVHTGELFDILHAAHINCGHGGRNRMELNLKSKYKNISRDIIMMYLSLCEACQKKHNQQKKGEAIYPGVVDTESSILEINEDVCTEENSWTIPVTLDSVEDTSQECFTECLNESQQVRSSDMTSQANDVQSYLFRRLTDAERKLTEIDEDESFCRMVISTLGRLPPRKNAEVKTKIMALLFEAEFGENQEMKHD